MGYEALGFCQGNRPCKNPFRGRDPPTFIFTMSDEVVKMSGETAKINLFHVIYPKFSHSNILEHREGISF
jgi:hypothetical protein